MLEAGIPIEPAHRHTLAQTFGWLHVAGPRSEPSRLQRMMGHASPEASSRHGDGEPATKHRRIERRQGDLRARRQRQRREWAAGRR
jgi:hypothetical protein